MCNEAKCDNMLYIFAGENVVPKQKDETEKRSTGLARRVFLSRDPPRDVHACCTISTTRLRWTAAPAACSLSRPVLPTREAALDAKNDPSTNPSADACSAVLLRMEMQYKVLKLDFRGFVQ